MLPVVNAPFRVYFAYNPIDGAGISAAAHRGGPLLVPQPGHIRVIRWSPTYGRLLSVLREADHVPLHHRPDVLTAGRVRRMIEFSDLGVCSLKKNLHRFFRLCPGSGRAGAGSVGLAEQSGHHQRAERYSADQGRTEGAAGIAGEVQPAQAEIGKEAGRSRRPAGPAEEGQRHHERRRQDPSSPHDIDTGQKIAAARQRRF